MADKSTVARPYARAAFEEARAAGELEPWSQALHVGATVVVDGRVEALLGNPHVTPEELARFLADDQANWRKMVDAAGITAE